MVFALCLAGKRDVYTLMITGASDGLQTIKTIAPALIVLMAFLGMFRASGAMDALTAVLTPVCQTIGIPPETVPLVVVRPFSGSAGLAVGSQLMAQYGPDSLIGRTVAVMLGSTETTFYTISVYFGAAKIHRTGYTVAAALIADFIGFFMAALTVKLLF